MRGFPVTIAAIAALLAARPGQTAETDSAVSPGPRVRPASAPAADLVERPPIAGRRIVKHFDFNEAPLGNYQGLPMQWRRHGAPGFPLFLEGRFDPAVGHDNPPSFRLDLDGGSVAYHYQGGDISVRTNSDYLVVAWVRTEAIESARAYLTACYLDRKGAVIAGTERRSELVGGTLDNEWRAITLGLPGGMADSRYVGITVWLAQAPVWNRATPGPHAIQNEDVRGRAWFDDITIYRLPRVALWSAQAGNVFAHDQPVELRTEVTDPDGLNLAAELILRDADDAEVERRPVAIHADRASGFERHVFAALPVGLYRAELHIRTGPTLLVRRELRFARLPAPINPDQVRGRHFGVVLDSVDPTLLEAHRRLLAHLRPEYVKLPVWTLQRETDIPTLDRYLQAIIEARGEPIGMLVDDRLGTTYSPAQAHEPRSLVDLLVQDPQSWKPLIASTWARYAGLVPVWQLGNDADQAIAADARLGSALAALRREMAPLMSQPVLATSGSVHELPASEQRADYHCVELGRRIPVADIAAHLGPAAAAFSDRCWSLIEPLPDSMPRRVRLSDLALRLAEALFVGRDGVFVRAPWDARPDALWPAIDPREDLIILRVVSDILGEAAPVSRLTIDGHAHCMVFDRNGRATLLAWDPQADPAGREHFLPLGPDAQVIDLWGRRRTLESVGRQQRLVIGPEPVFVVNTSTWMIEFLRQFRMEPASIEFSHEPCERTIAFRNTYREAISGMLRLVGPPDWDIRPGRIPFSLGPGEELRQTVSIRFPTNAQAGVLPLVGDFELDADRRYQFNAPAWFELMLRDIDLQTYTYRVNDRLIVRQTMTNRTDAPVHFQGYVLAPGRARIERTFAQFEPGQSVTKDFILENAGELSGRQIRIGLKEIQGTRVWNQVLTVP